MQTFNIIPVYTAPGSVAAISLFGSDLVCDGTIALVDRLLFKKHEGLEEEGSSPVDTSVHEKGYFLNSAESTHGYESCIYHIYRLSDVFTMLISILLIIKIVLIIHIISRYIHT